jgi:hypothetical protein
MGGHLPKWSVRVGEELARLVSHGDTIKEAAKSAGVHPVTVYRSQKERPEFYDAMLQADRAPSAIAPARLGQAPARAVA